MEDSDRSVSFRGSRFQLDALCLFNAEGLARWTDVAPSTLRRRAEQALRMGEIAPLRREWSAVQDVGRRQCCRQSQETCLQSNAFLLSMRKERFLRQESKKIDDEYRVVRVGDSALRRPRMVWPR